MKSPCFYTKLCKLIQFQVGIELSTKELRGEYDFQMKKIPAQLEDFVAIVGFFCLQACLSDIKLAIEAGYPTNMVYKLYIRQCKCLLELGHIADAQKAFDKAVDAIDR